MNTDTKNVLYAMALPTTTMVLVIIIGAFILVTAKSLTDTTNTLVLTGMAGTLMIGAVLYWDIATEIRLFRKDINDIKKLP